MSSKIPVGRSFKRWSFWIFLVLSLMFMGLVPVVPESKTVMLMIAGVFIAITIMIGGYVKAGKRWLKLREGGFIIFDRLGEREFDEEDVGKISQRMEKNFSQGLPKSITRSVRIWVEIGSASERIDMVHTLKTDEADPFGDLMDRLMNNIHARARANIDKGLALEGEGWKVTQADVELKTAGGMQPYRFDQIAAVDVFDDTVCIWETGVEDPVFRLAVESPNALVLGKLVSESLPEQKEGAEPPKGSLGRVLFERKTSASTIRILWMLGVAGVGLGMVLLFLGKKEMPVAVPFVSIGVGLILAFAGYYKMKARFRAHEHGVCKRGPFNETRLRYLDVGTFTYQATRQFVNGGYTGTSFNMGFQPLPGVGGGRVNYMTTLKGQDEELENLREHISGVIAGRMAKDLAEEKPVQWTPSLRITSEGIEHTPSGFFGGKKETVVYPFDQIQNFELQEGYFHLWIRDRDKSVVQEAVSQPNFFPGFMLLGNLYNQASEEDAPQA